jgi:phospholipid/cholesterol/gamma-HCH transport system ATP-binding protein
MHFLPFSGHCHMSKETNIAVEFKNVTKSFAEKRVLNNVSFRLEHGQVLCLLGRSGTGKSVALKIMMALMCPDAGEVWIDFENVVGLNEDGLSRVRKKLGYLFQDAALFDSFTLYENLALPLSRLTKKSKREIDDVVHAVLSDVGLGADGAKYPSALSGGMRKRAGLARAIVLEPRLLLADEPSSGLDRITSSEIHDLLLRCKEQRGMGMIIVTHDIHEARRIADCVAVLDKGDLVAFGSFDEIASSGNEVARRLIEA